MKSFAERMPWDDVDNKIEAINDLVKPQGARELWRDDSPIWARPQDAPYPTWPEGYMQIVGHTPMERPTYVNGVLTLDTYSTYRDGITPIGSHRLCIVDTEKRTWEYA